MSPPLAGVGMRGVGKDAQTEPPYESRGFPYQCLRKCRLAHIQVPLGERWIDVNSVVQTVPSYLRMRECRLKIIRIRL